MRVDEKKKQKKKIIRRSREIEMAYHIISYDAAVHQPEISLPLKNLLSHSLQITNQNPTPTSRAFSSFRTVSQTEQSWGATQRENSGLGHGFTITVQMVTDHKELRHH
jgi:hypothetical protein